MLGRTSPEEIKKYWQLNALCSIWSPCLLLQGAVVLTQQASKFQWTPGKIALSLALFLAAGLAEIAGGWLVWQAVRGQLADKAKPFLQNRKLWYQLQLAAAALWATASCLLPNPCQPLEGSMQCMVDFLLPCPMPGVGLWTVRNQTKVGWLPTPTSLDTSHFVSLQCASAV